MNNMPDDGVINKPAKTPSPAHTQRFRVPARPPRERTGVYISHEGIADLTLKRVHESRLAQDEIANIFSGGGQAVTSVKNILRNAVVEEDRLAHFVCDNQGRRIDIDAIRDSLIGVSEFAPSAKFDHPEGGTSLHLGVAILYCNEPVGRRFLLSNAPISILGALERTAELDVKFYSCITGRRSITLAGRPGEYRYIYLATPEIERAVLGMCERYPATDSTLIHLEEVRHSPGSAPVIDLPTPTKAQEHEQDMAFMTERERANARKRETSIPAPAKTTVPPVPEQAPQPMPEAQKATPPEAPAAQEAPKDVPEAAPAGKRIATNTLGLGLEDLDGRKKVGNEADLKKLFNTPYSICTITTEGGHSIRAAEETRFATFLGESPEFIPASDLEEGDIIYRGTKEGPAPEKITGIKKVEFGQNVILRRIRAEGESMIFADGFAVSGMVSLLPDAMVDTPVGRRKAETLESGDEAVSFSDGEYKASSVVNTFKVERGFLFRGMEVELTSGTRLLMLPIHPQTLADKCPAVLDYADTQRYIEVEYDNGKKVYYVLVKQRQSGLSFGFSLTPMENTLQVLEDPPIAAAPAPPSIPDQLAVLPEPFESIAPAKKAEAPVPAIQEIAPEAPAAEKAGPQQPEAVKAEPQPPAELEKESPLEAMAPPSAEQIRGEAFGEVRKFALGILGSSPIPPTEAIFGENLAILVQAGKSQYIVTDAEDWNSAREAMQKHLSSGDEGVMLTEIQNAWSRKKKPLPSGGVVTVFVKPVGISRVYKGAHGETHSDTLEVIPKTAIEAAISRAETPRDPESKRRAAQVAALLKSTTIHSSGGPETEKAMDIIVDPESIVEVSPSESRRYLLAKTSDGSVHAILRFPCPPGELSGEITSMPAALVFTSADYPGVSYVLMEKKFLAPGLEEWMLANWKA